MPLKTEDLEEPGLNLTSMLDVCMLLIIFFMVCSTVTESERQYDVQLPTVSDARALSSQPDEIVVNIDSSGRILVKTKERSLPELEQFLGDAQKNFPGQSVVIRGDGTGRYQPVMDVMAACRRANIRNISLAHRPPSGS